MEENFPIVSYSLCLINFTIFLLTQMEPEYIQSFGFIPSIFRPYTLFTYMFIHSDIFHLLFNWMMLLSLGFVLERVIGRKLFLSIYVSSGFTAVFFDSIGRLLLGIPLSYPLIGSSGAIFGLLAVMALIRPLEKLPSFLVFANIIPFLFLIFKFEIILANPFFMGLVLAFFLMLSVIALVFKPGIPSLYALFLYFVFWLFLLLVGPKESISHFGHLGGIFGGMFAFLLFATVS